MPTSFAVGKVILRFFSDMVDHQGPREHGAILAI